jgi:hypothetical protein
VQCISQEYSTKEVAEFLVVESSVADRLTLKDLPPLAPMPNPVESL